MLTDWASLHRRAVAEDVLDRASEGSAGQSAEVREDKAATQQLLMQLAGSLLAEGDARPARRAPRVLAAASQLIGAYALWFANTADAPVEAALRYLLRAMGVPEVRLDCPSMAVAEVLHAEDR